MPTRDSMVLIVSCARCDRPLRWSTCKRSRASLLRPGLPDPRCSPGQRLELATRVVEHRLDKGADMSARASRGIEQWKDAGTRGGESSLDGRIVQSPPAVNPRAADESSWVSRRSAEARTPWRTPPAGQARSSSTRPRLSEDLSPPRWRPITGTSAGAATRGLRRRVRAPRSSGAQRPRRLLTSRDAPLTAGCRNQ
jgi:hypothetical protein